MSSKINSKSYLYGLILGLFLAALPVAWFSWYVDPFCFFEKNPHGMYFHTERQCKVIPIKKSSYDGIIIGNSRAAWLDPENVLGNDFINVSFSGASLYEMYVFLDKFLKDKKKVYIGIDFEMLYLDGNDEALLEEKTSFDKSLVDYVENSLSFEVVSKSAAVHFFRDSFTPSIPLGKFWQRIPRPGSSEAERKAKGQIAEYKTRYEHNAGLASEEVLSARLDLLKRIKDIFDKRKIDYCVFVNPIFPERRKLYADAHPELFTYAKQHDSVLKDVFTHVVDFSFDETFESSDFRDWSHFYPSAGDRMLYKLKKECK